MPTDRFACGGDGARSFLSAATASLLLAVALSVGSALRAQTDMNATASAIGCESPDKLQAAEKAQRAHDRSLMDQLSYFPIAAGTLARRIDNGTSTSLWQVRLDPDGASSMDVWARPSSFQVD